MRTAIHRERSSVNALERAAFNHAIQLQLDLLRHAASVEGKVLRLLEEMHRQLRGKLASENLTTFNRTRLNAMLKETSKVLDTTYARIADEVRKSMEGVAGVVSSPSMDIAKLKVTLSKVDVKLGYSLVNVDIGALERQWSRSSFYVGPQGTGGIGKRYADVTKFIQDNSAFEASSVYVKPDGVVGFENGRHRYAAIRDAGNKTIPVAMDAESIANAKAAGYLAAGDPTTFTVRLVGAAPTPAVLATLVKNTLIEGAPSAQWWDRQAKDTAFRFSSAVRQGIAQGETTEQIFRRTKEVVGLAGRNSRALVQTSIAQVAGDVRIATIEANTDIYSGFRHLSTLDGHTTPQCVARSGLMWTLDKEPIGHDLPFKQPPVHWGCRSVMLGVLKSFKELGINLPEPQGLTRASAEGQIDRSTTFASFLSRRSVAEQDAQLGAGRAQLWRDGKITLRQLVDNAGNPLTLEQLRSKYE